MFSERLAELAVDVQAEAMARLLTSGFLRLYDGEQPGSPDNNPIGVLLAELRLGSFTTSVNGLIIGQNVKPDLDARADGTAKWFRCLTSQEKPVMDGSVGVKDANLMMRSVEIRKGSEVFLDVFRYVSRKSEIQ